MIFALVVLAMYFICAYINFSIWPFGIIRVSQYLIVSLFK